MVESALLPIYSMCPPRNPYLGYFHHAPSAKNRASNFFKDALMTVEVFETVKFYKHYPYTGYFHGVPNRSSIWAVRQQEEKKAQEMRGNDWDIHQSRRDSETTIASSSVSAGVISKSKDVQVDDATSQTLQTALNHMRRGDKPESWELSFTLRRMLSSKCGDDSDDDSVGGHVEPKYQAMQPPPLLPVVDAVGTPAHLSPTGSWQPQTKRARECSSRPKVMRKRMTRGRNTHSRAHAPLLECEGDILDHYDVLDSVLGEGAYAVLRRAIHKTTGQMVAIKAIRKCVLFTSEEQLAVRREVSIHAALRHPNVIALSEVFEDDDHIYLVLELSDRGTLKQLLQYRRSLDEVEAACLARQLLDAVAYLHEGGVLHCDIKPDNVLLSSTPEFSYLIPTEGAASAASLPSLSSSTSSLPSTITAVTGGGGGSTPTPIPSCHGDDGEEGSGAASVGKVMVVGSGGAAADSAAAGLALRSRPGSACSSVASSMSSCGGGGGEGEGPELDSRAWAARLRRGKTSNKWNNNREICRKVIVKLCDFGLARKVPNARYFKITGDVRKVPFTGLCGTEGYVAPELMMQQHYGQAADLWSVGILLFEMLAGYSPFYPHKACLTEDVSFGDRVWKKLSPEATDLVGKLLERDPVRRLTAAQALSHPWFAVDSY